MEFNLIKQRETKIDNLLSNLIKVADGVNIIGDGKKTVREAESLEIIDELTSEELNKMLKVSTTIHGAYRSDEKSAMEVHAIGQYFLQFKKYFPALLIQEW